MPERYYPLMRADLSCNVATLSTNDSFWTNVVLPSHFSIFRSTNIQRYLDDGSTATLDAN